MDGSLAVIADQACCGTTPCDGHFEDWFAQVRYLYPDFQEKLCPNGVFDNLVKALASGFWNLYICDCGLCDFLRETSPMTACCTFDRWVEEFGVLDDPCFDPVCFMNGEERILSLRAHLRARAMLEWNGTFNRALLDTIAEPLGIAYTTFGIASGASCAGPIAAGGLQGKPADSDPEDCMPVTLGQSGDCRIVPQMVTIKILRAPPWVYASACDLAAQPFAYNAYVEAFKCLVASLKPQHLIVCWDDVSRGAPPKAPPVEPNPCPNAQGHFTDPTIAGTGTEEDPYRIDFSAISPEQMVLFAARLKQANPMIGDDILAGTPTLDSPDLGQTHLLGDGDLTGGIPTLDSPELTEGA